MLLTGRRCGLSSGLQSAIMRHWDEGVTDPEMLSNLKNQEKRYFGLESVDCFNL